MPPISIGPGSPETPDFTVELGLGSAKKPTGEANRRAIER